MRAFYVSCLLLAGLMPSTLAAQTTRIEAQQGVAAQKIEDSPITIGLPPAEQVRMVEIFALQITVSSEARAKAEARAAELAAQLNVTQAVVIGFFKIIGEQDVPAEQIGLKLGEIAAKHRALTERRSVLDGADPATAALAEEAKAAIDSGRYDQAENLLSRASDLKAAAARKAAELANEAQHAAERIWLEFAETEGKRGDLAMTRLRYLEAAKHYASAANAVPATRQDERRQYLWREVNALYTQADERGDVEAAKMAIDRCRMLAASVHRAVAPLEWARTQRNLGLALQLLGERGSGTASLEEAVTAYRAALEERTRERVPLQWAMTLDDLASAFYALGLRESGTTRLNEAVTAHRAALEEQPRHLVPLQWAATQDKLGSALQALGERESGTRYLEEAVVAFRAALEERTRERVPLAWATTQSNLGNALAALGEREKGTTHLEAAVAAYRAALEEQTRDRAPLNWARMQSNLGGALLRLGERESGTTRLEEAIAVFQAALEELARERVPLDWARTQNNLGSALKALGERETGTARLEEAVVAFKSALEEWIRSRVPFLWATGMNNLGTALKALGERETGIVRLEEAVVAHRAALKEWTRERAPLQWAMTQNNLGDALQVLAQREAGTARFEEAIAAWDLSLPVFEVEWPAAWVQVVRDKRNEVASEIARRRETK